MDRPTCHECKRGDDEIRLYRCPTCYKQVCEEHAFRLSGLAFCCRACGEYFFHADPDE